MRVGFVLYAFETGGMETFLMRIGRYLSSRGVEVDYLVTGWEGCWESMAIREGFRVHKLYQQCSSLSAGLRAFAWQACSARYDVLFLNHSSLGQAAIPFIPSATVVAPILHNHCEPIYALGARNASGWNAAICPSTGILSEIRRRVPFRPSFHIPYGVPTVAAGAANAVRQRDNGIKLLFVGRIEDGQKGVFLLPGILQGVLERGVQATLTIVGSGPDEEELKRRFRAQGIHRLVTFQGQASPADAMKAMLDHEILLLPSNYEGLCIVLLESMNCGCVPVASNLPGVTDDAITDGENGRLVLKGHPEEFTSAVVELALNPEGLARMRANAVHVASHKFSVETMGRAYMDFLALVRTGDLDLRWPRMLTTGWDRELIPPKELIPTDIRRAGKRVLARLWPGYFAQARQTNS